MEAAAAGAGLLPPAEADWPPELRLPAPPPPPPAEPPPAQPAGMDDSQFLGSIMGDPARQGPAEAPPPPQQAPAVPKRRGRPPKKKDGAVVVAAPKPAKRREEDDEEVVCFICFDGGNLVVCDRRGCPKVYHPACIKREESFFNSRTKWNCGWHICSSCEKAVQYMCYTCTYSLCKACIKQGKFFSVRGNKGFCDTCFGTILLIESKDEAAAKVDFDDINSWEYLFKLYWLDVKGKLSLTLEELTSAKSRWTVPNTCARKEKAESSDDLYDINNDDDAGSDCSSRKRRRNNLSRNKGRKRQKIISDSSIAANKAVPAIRDPGILTAKVPSEGVSMPVEMKWASPELLDFVGHARDGDRSFMSQFEVQTLLLEYIKKNNLRDPRRKSQIICDARLHRVFRKTRVAHFEMLKLLEMHFPVNETPRVNDNGQVAIDLNSTQMDTNAYIGMAAKPSPEKRRRIHRKMEREPHVNPEAYAAVDMHNINLIYLRRSLMEDLIDDATFLDKICGAFVRIKISGVGQKQDMYRLVKVVGAHKIPEKYSTGNKTTNFVIEILNLDKKETITVDAISNQDFTEEECNRLRQTMKCGLISRLKVGAVQEKAKVLQSVRVNDWLENEKQRLEHLRDRASETGRKKELRECVEKLQLLNDSGERTRRINEVLEVHVDSHMDPNYESAEEMDGQKSVGTNISRIRADTMKSRRKSEYPNSVQNHTRKIADANHHPKNLSTESAVWGTRTGRKFENLHPTNGTDIPKPSTGYEAGSLSSSVLIMSSEIEPEKVWHYKDPSGNVQGPFTLLQLSKWTCYFPRDMRVWLTFESEERSLLLTEVLSKQQTVFTQTTAVTTSTKATSAGIERNINGPSVDHTNALSPTDYNMINSSVATVQTNKYSVPERESVNSTDDCLSLSTSSVPPKNHHTLHSQVNCQTKHSVFVQSSGNLCGQTDLRQDGAPGGCSGESNHHHSSGALRRSIPAQVSYSGKSNVASHDHKQHTLWSQSQHDPKSSSQGVSVKDLSKNLPSQRVGKDVPSPVIAWSPSESRTTSSQHDGSCLSSTSNPSFLDEHHSSIASAKPKSCGPATPIEDRGSSSPSGMLSHSERVPICSPQSTPSASPDICKMEEIMNQQRTLEADTSNASVNQSSESKILPTSSPDNEDDQDIDREFPSPTPRPENKEHLVDNSGLTPASPENLANTYSPVSDPCKTEEIMNQPRVLETGTSNSSGNHYPLSNKKDLEREHLSPTTRSDDKEPAVDNSLSISAATENLRTDCASDADTCKTEVAVNQQKPLEMDALNSSLNQSPHSNIFPLSSTDNQDIEHACPSPTPRSGNKVPSLDNSGSAAPENVPTATASASGACKMEEILDNKITIKTDASIGSITPPQTNVSLVTSPDNQDIECEFPTPAPRSEKEPHVSNSVCVSAAPENAHNTAFSSDGCKMEKIVDQKTTLETEVSNGLVTPSPQSMELTASPDNQDIQREYHSPTPGLENKEPVEDNSKLILTAPENETTKVPDDSQDAFVSLKSDPPTGKLNATESDFKGVEEIIQNELFSESTVVTKENLVIDPSCGTESIDVSDVLESLMEQRCGTSYMHGTAALEDLLAASAEEEPQCSSPIALSPWGEPSYYQGDAVDCTLWGVQDDAVNDMWSLIPPTPVLRPSSADLGTEANETLDINEVAVSHGINEFLQSGPTPVEANVNQAISGAATDCVQPKQVKSTPNDVSTSSVDESTGIVGWQPLADQRVSAVTALGTSQSLYLPSCEKAATSSKSTWEASRKQEYTDSSVSSSGQATGNINKGNPPSVIASKGRQQNHRRGRYSEISESWLLSSNNSRSRSDRFGNGGSRRP